MKVAVTGSTGFIGSELVARLKFREHDVIRLVRRKPENADEVSWDPADGKVEAESLEGIDACVHLAGENIAAGRWTGKRKTALRESRVKGTSLIAKTLAALKNPPEVLISASGVGIYGDRGDRIVTEEWGAGKGFLAALAQDWEAAARPAVDAGIRVVFARFGAVLSVNGGALAKMFLPFRLGLGGRLGSGKQYMSWIALDDAISAIIHILLDRSVSGPINFVAPKPVTNNKFVKTLGRVLRRPVFLPAPAFMLRLAFGEMADEALLASTRAVPALLIESGFEFRHPELEDALRSILSRKRKG